MKSNREALKETFQVFGIILICFIVIGWICLTAWLGSFGYTITAIVSFVVGMFLIGFFGNKYDNGMY